MFPLEIFASSSSPMPPPPCSLLLSLVITLFFNDLSSSSEIVLIAHKAETNSSDCLVSTKLVEQSENLFSDSEFEKTNNESGVDEW